MNLTEQQQQELREHLHDIYKSGKEYGGLQWWECQYLLNALDENKALKELIHQKRELNTYDRAGIKWTMPDENINISIKELNQLLNTKTDKQ